MSKPLFRFTVGPCIPQGLEVLKESVKKTTATLGIDAFDWMICHNGLSEDEQAQLSDMTKDLPIVFPEMAMSEVIVEMTNGNLGLAIVQKQNKIVGLITDGDLRRMLLKKQDLNNTKALEVMNPSPITVLADEKISSARKKMIDTKLQSLVVTDEKRKILGIIQIF